LRLPAAFHGAWRSVIDGNEVGLGAGARVADLVGPRAFALLERA
jgi:hypothetical protein